MEELNRTAIPAGMRYLLRLNVKPDARLTRNSPDRFTVDMNAMERVAQAIAPCQEGAERVYVHPTGLTIVCQEPVRKRMRDLTEIVTEAISMFTVRQNQIFYASDPIGFASGKPPIILASGNIFVTEAGKEEQAVDELQGVHEEKYGARNRWAMLVKANDEWMRE